MRLLPGRFTTGPIFQLSSLQPSRHHLLQVSYISKVKLYLFFFSPKIFISSHPRNYSLPSRSCKIPCHGLYSDVEHEAISQTVGLETPGMSQLMKEYLSYKRGNLTDPVPYLLGTFPIQYWKIFNCICFRRRTRAQTAHSEHLLQHSNSGSDHERRENQHYDPDLCDRRHSGTFYGIFNHERIWDCLFCGENCFGNPGEA